MYPYTNSGEFDNGEIGTGIVLAKTKITPDKKRKRTSIARLELAIMWECAELGTKVVDTLGLTEIHLLSNSKVAIAQTLRGKAKGVATLKLFVANRVEVILKKIDVEKLHYIPTGVNPTDLCTRAMPFQDIRSDLWLNGPNFLQKPVVEFPPKTINSETISDDQLELRKNPYSWWESC